MFLSYNRNPDAAQAVVQRIVANNRAEVEKAYAAALENGATNVLAL